MVSGAGRRLTCRSAAAWLARCVTVRGSRRYAAARAAAMICRSPAPSNVPVSGGELFVDGGPVLRGQAGGFPDQEGGAPFVELPGFQRGESVGHFGDQGLGQAQEPAAFGGGFAPGEGDLRADPGPELGRGHPGVGLFAALEQVQRDGEAGLRRGRGRFQVLELPELADQSGTVTGRPDSGQRPGHLRDRHAHWLKCVGLLLAFHDQTLLLSSDIKMESQGGRTGNTPK